MERHLNSIKSQSLIAGLQIRKRKTKYKTNYTDILTEQGKKLEKSYKLKYIGQTTQTLQQKTPMPLLE